MRRPKCPMCGGKAIIEDSNHICPECVEDPGFASMDRIMAIANGVINDVDEHGTGTWQSVREYLIHCELSKR